MSRLSKVIIITYIHAHIRTYVRTDRQTNIQIMPPRTLAYRFAGVSYKCKVSLAWHARQIYIVNNTIKHWLVHCKGGELTWTSLEHYNRINFPADKNISKMFYPTRRNLQKKIWIRPDPTVSRINQTRWHLWSKQHHFTRRHCWAINTHDIMQKYYAWSSLLNIAVLETPWITWP